MSAGCYRDSNCGDGGQDDIGSGDFDGNDSNDFKWYPGDEATSVAVAVAVAGGGDWESAVLQGVDVAEWNGDPASLGFSSFTRGLNVGTYQNIVPSECADSDIGEEDLINPAMGKMGVDWKKWRLRGMSLR